MDIGDLGFKLIDTKNNPLDMYPKSTTQEEKARMDNKQTSIQILLDQFHIDRELVDECDQQTSKQHYATSHSGNSISIPIGEAIDQYSIAFRCSLCKQNMNTQEMIEHLRLTHGISMADLAET